MNENIHIEDRHKFGYLTMVYVIYINVIFNHILNPIINIHPKVPTFMNFLGTPLYLSIGTMPGEAGISQSLYSVIIRTIDKWDDKWK